MRMVEARRPQATLIHLDTSVVVDALTGARRSGPALRHAIVDGERLAFSLVVLFECLRGARSEAAIAIAATALRAEYTAGRRCS